MPTAAPAEVTDAAFNGCNKVPRGKRVVHVGLPPDTDVNHLIAWISSLTCKPFVYAFDTTSHNRNVTIVAPKFVTPEEAFGIVFGALDSVGLTMRPVGDFFQIIESQAAHTGPIPVYDYDGHRIHDEPRPHH